MAKIKKKQQVEHFEPQAELQSIADSVAGLYKKYQTQANAVLTLAIVALVVALVYSTSKAGKEAKAGQMLDSAYVLMNPPAGVAPDYTKANQALQEVVQQYGGTLSGATARYLAGNALAAAGRSEEALKTYDQFLQEHGGQKLLAAMVHQRKGYLYAGLGKREDAVKSFTQAEQLGGPGVATLELARIYEQSGAPDEAQKKYKELNEKLPATTLALEAKMKLPPPDMKPPITAPAPAK